jgi:hypothetical protein
MQARAMIFLAIVAAAAAGVQAWNSGRATL